MNQTERDNLEQLEKRHLWHPFTPMRDWVAGDITFIESGDGVMLTDTEGREYYDAHSSMWLNVHGHRKAAIDAAIIEQLGKVAHATMLGLTHEPGARLAARLIDIAPAGLSRVFYSDGGSEAIEIALKMAFQYWLHRGQDRTRFIALSEGYHGDTVGAMSVGGIGVFHGIFRKLLFTADFVPSPSRARNAEEAADQLEAVLKANLGQVFAVVIEPLVQIAGGVLISPPGYLKRVRELCNQYDTLLIFDEIATGFGRTGRMFACDHEGICPDMMCLGKGLTGGYLPLAATLTTEDIYSAFLGDYAEGKTFTHGHSYTGNPLACAAAMASLDIFEREQVIASLPAKIECIRQCLEPFKLMPHVGEIRHFGMIVGIELVANRDKGEAYPAASTMGARVCRRARTLGLITRPLGNVVTFIPPLSSTENELSAMLAIIREAMRWETEGE